MIDTIKRIWCAIFGHTRVVDVDFYRQYCARCGAQVGDMLQGTQIKNPVVIGHLDKSGKPCKTCKEHWKRAPWHERILVPNPMQPRRAGK